LNKTVIIGCGNLARIHINKLRKLFPSIVIALVDIDQKRLDQFADEFQVTERYTSIEDMLAQFSPDVAHVVTPPASHFFLAKQLLENSVHCLVEKPFTISTDEAKTLLALAKEKNCRLTVNHMRAFDPLLDKAKQLIEQKQFGKVMRVHGRYSFDFYEDRKFDPTSRWMTKLPGGPLFDLAPHVLSAMEAFTGELKQESSQIQDQDGMIMQCQFNFSASDNIIADAYLNLNSKPLKNEIMVECENGSLTLDFRNFLIVLRKPLGLPNAIERILGNVHIGWQMMWGSVTSVYKFVTGKLDPYAGMDGLFRDLYGDEMKNILADDALRYLENMSQDPIFSPAEIVEKALEPLTDADILVTGSGGFLGRPLVKRLLSQGVKVRVLAHSKVADKSIWGEHGEQVDVVVGDIYNVALVDHVVNGVKKVYHLAAAMNGPWGYHLDTTVTGTKNLLDACAQHNIEHLLYMSTLNVYAAKDYRSGKTVSEDFTYESMPEKRGHYSHAKLIAEKMVLAHAENNATMKLSVFRPGLIYGQGLDPVLGDLGIKLGKRLVVCMGMGKRKLPLVNVENVVDACVASLTEQQDQVELYSLVDNDYPTQNTYINKLNASGEYNKILLPVPLVVFKLAFSTLDFLLKHLLKRDMNLAYRLKCISASPKFSTDNAKNQLAWQQNVSFEDGLKLSIEHAQQNS